MYISSIAIVFSSTDNLSLCTTCISLNYSVGCTLMHALEFLYKNPIVKSYLRNNYYIINLSFKYSNISDL
jgi:uncharacterized protein (DUF1919 family)